MRSLVKVGTMKDYYCHLIYTRHLDTLSRNGCTASDTFNEVA